MLRRFAILSFLAVFIVVAVAWPQAGVSTVRGTARDPSQAVVPAATVKLTNIDTNVTRTTKTNDVGIFAFPSVIPGRYRITIEASGFQNFEGTLTVMVQQDAEVDGVLQLGQTATQVEVADVTQMVRVDSPTLGHVLERQRIEQLPINGRSYQNLLATVPGIDSTGIPQAYGMRTNTSVTLFDGTAVNESYEGWDFGRPPGLDSIAEFQMEVNNSSAKFTRPATIILSSKSGTNVFHGSLFETNRNSGYGVARRRQDNFQKPPFLNRNEFGASAGGPIYVPKLYDGRNRTFFFFAWEASRNLSSSTQQWSVPTEAMRNGDFRGLVDDSGRQYQLYDPFTTDPVTWERQPLTYNGVANMIDPARISPTAKYLFSITPLPTLPQVNPLIDVNWVGPFSGYTNGSNTSIRIDHRISDADLLYGRYSFNTYKRLTSYGGQPMLNGVAGTENYDRPNHTVGVTWVHTLSPTMTNEVVGSASHENHFRGMGDRKTNYVRDILGLPNPFNEVDWPSFEGFDLGEYTFGTDGLFTLITNFVSLQDNVTKIQGKHEFQFGVHTRFELLNNSRAAYPNGPFSYATLGTSLYDPDSTPDDPLPFEYTGHGMANMYLGIMDYNVNFLRPAFDFRRREYAGYLQDNWKVTPRLTLNLGLRYEVRPPIYDARGTLIGFSLDKRAFVVGESVDKYLQQGISLPSIVNAIQGYGGKIIPYNEAGLPQHLMYTNWRELGPRLGFAYRALDGAKAFVVRGGFRMSYYPQKMQDWAENQYSSPPGSATFSYSVTDPAFSPDGLPNYGLRSAPTYIAGVNSTNDIIDVNNASTLTRGFSARVLPSNYTDGGVADWNFTLEKEVMASTVVRVAYVGNHGYNQQQYVGYNDSTPSYVWYASRGEPLPTGEFAGVATRPYDQTVYGGINMFSSIGWSNHTSFQFELERRYHNGLGFQVFYRTAKTLLTNRDTDGTQSGETIHSLNFYMPDAVPTDLKERNRFLNYRMDPNTPHHRLQWNFIVELPFGRGKRFGTNMHSVLDKIMGGWQIAGLGSVTSSWWSLPTTYYRTDQNIEVYGYKYPIQDCRSGRCYPGYLWWNGYIPSNLINSHDEDGNPNGIMGVPSDYKPAAQPLIPWGQTELPPNAPPGTDLESYWDTNTVWLKLNNGKTQRVTYNTSLPPWRNQYSPGPRQWFQDASLFKFVRLSERLNLRFNVDFFNVFNNPNNPTSAAANGVLATRNSGSAARTTQLTVRLSW
ncbi:MAG TPA: TonB-dependent receptor [Bryobacteraceae bacterium]|nr:TonB-dependent receptor [Bryobacteraceae bacterium]